MVLMFNIPASAVRTSYLKRIECVLYASVDVRKFFTMEICICCTDLL